jgi:hypothetical protein
LSFFIFTGGEMKYGKNVEDALLQNLKTQSYEDLEIVFLVLGGFGCVWTT